MTAGRNHGLDIGKRIAALRPTTAATALPGLSIVLEIDGPPNCFGSIDDLVVRQRTAFALKRIMDDGIDWFAHVRASSLLVVVQCTGGESPPALIELLSKNISALLGVDASGRAYLLDGTETLDAVLWSAWDEERESALSMGRANLPHKALREQSILHLQALLGDLWTSAPSWSRSGCLVGPSLVGATHSFPTTRRELQHMVDASRIAEARKVA